MKQFFNEWIKPVFQRIAAFYRGLISGIWIVNFMRQVIITGANIAESTFLLATLWVIINAVAHTLVTWVISTHTIELINSLSAIAFSALPELIIIPVIIVCYGHWHTAIKHRSVASGVWAVLYSVPAFFFLVMTIITITTFVSTKGTQFVPLDGVQLVIRCLSGWMYAVVNMLFQKLGEPHYASKLSERDTEIGQLKTRIETLVAEYSAEKQNLIAEHSMKIEDLTTMLKTQSQQVNLLAEKASSLELRGLDAYPKVVNEWIEKGIKTVSIGEIEAFTGHSRRVINAAIKSGKLQKDNRNKDLIRVSSVVEWLKVIPLPETPIQSSIDQSINHNGHSIVSEQNTDSLVPLTV